MNYLASRMNSSDCRASSLWLRLRRCFRLIPH